MNPRQLFFRPEMNTYLKCGETLFLAVMDKCRAYRVPLDRYRGMISVLEEGVPALQKIADELGVELRVFKTRCVFKTSDFGIDHEEALKLRAD